MKRKTMRLRPVLMHNRGLLTLTSVAVFLLIYLILAARYYPHLNNLRFQFALAGISLGFSLLYLAFMVGQLYFDLKKKRKFFYKKPIKYLLQENFQIGFSKLNAWNYASTWCLHKSTDAGVLELDVDRIASEQKNYLHLRFRPTNYQARAYVKADIKKHLDALDGEADKECLIFFKEELKVKNMTIEELSEWIRLCIQSAE